MRPRYTKKMLQWWEGRTPDQLPEYVKTDSFNDFEHTVWVGKINEECFYYWSGTDFLGLSFRKGGGLLPEYFLPATEQEYKDFKEREGKK